MWRLTKEEQLILIFLISVFAVGLGVKFLGGIPVGPPSQPSLIKVKIYGAVKRSGWYKVNPNSSVGDLIKKAGGTFPWADLSQIDLSQPLSGETTIYIPQGKMDLNRVSEKDLTFLPGIGPELASRIINYRDKKGGFKSIYELKNITGIGKVRFEKIKDKITVGKSGGKDG